MHGLTIFLRTTKILGKAILGLLVIFLMAIAIVHLPSVQEWGTRKLSNYLSSKIDASVSIRSVKFSIFGDVIIEDLAVWDPGQNTILSARKIEAQSDIFDLLTGELIFDDVHLAGIEGHLVQSKEGLNIQFIIDAFKSKEPSESPNSNPVNLVFKKLVLENIVFEYTSTVEEITVSANLGMFIVQEAEVSTNPISIKAIQIVLDHTVVNTFSTYHMDSIPSSNTSKKETSLSPDLGTGIIFEIKELALLNNEFSFHQNDVMNTPKFDPAHLAMKNIQLRMTDILMSEDSLSLGLQSFAVQLPGFTLANSKADLKMNRKQLFLSGLHVVSGSSELRANLTTPYNFRSSGDTAHALTEMALQCQITPADFAYFLSDSVMNQFNPWGATCLTLEGHYNMATGKLRALNINTEESQVHASGMLHHVSDLNKISWNEMMINASFGSDLKKPLAPFLKKINVPPDIILRLKTSGNTKTLFADAKIFTRWGNVKSVGMVMPRRNNMDIDMNLTGENVDLREWLTQPSLGPVNLEVRANGTIGDDQHIDVSGVIHKVELLGQSIQHISFKSATTSTNSSVIVSIDDPNYRSEISSEISFQGPLTFKNDIQLDDFKLGRLLHMDTTLTLSAKSKSELTIDRSFLEVHIEGRRVSFQNQSTEYSLDTMFVHGLISSTRSDLEYFTETAKATLASNFDIRDASGIIQTWSQNLIAGDDIPTYSKRNRTASLDIELEDPSFLNLLGIDVDKFSFLRVVGKFDEQRESATLQGISENFKGYGISLDTLNTNLTILRNVVTVGMKVNNLSYDSIRLGHLDFDMFSNRDSATTNLVLVNDSLTLLHLSSHILSTDSGRLIYPEKLVALNNEYSIDPKNPVHIKNKSLTFNHFNISRNNMHVNIDGDVSQFHVSVEHLNLAPLNFLLSRDTTIINKGFVTGEVSFSHDRQVDLKAKIDSLSLYNSSPLSVEAVAVTDAKQLPFNLRVTNESNKADLNGRYFTDSGEVDATLLLDINDPEIFQFLTSGIFNELKGAIKGRTTIRGPLQNPRFNGSLRFIDVRLTTVNPRLSVNVQDDSIVLENTGLRFNNFTVHDKQHRPLTITGNVDFQDYKSMLYDLHLTSNGFSFVNNADSAGSKLRGLLLVDSDIKLKGNTKDTNIAAKLTIKDSTNITLVTSSGDVELINADGIIEFVDPAQLLDSAALGTINYYDSLIASLPEFNLHSTVAVEDKAAFRVIINEQSGDYIEATGKANLELDYDRTRNLSLSGNYTINNGVYRLSFYDLVKKNFELVRGSSINWSGSPENGILNIKARHTVQSNSIGLIGYEISESEKSVYKKSLDYEVGINISGTIARPIIEFSLDLPPDNRVSYPVLASKLDRLRQPEYQSELNKQVFGLLVLGGFLPETNTGGVNSGLVATTALSNSVNALLASQLNRFASHYIKGVNIDVGIHSYSDYSAPGGKTQTAMDFRVSKSIMNDRLSFEMGGDFDIAQDQSGANTGKNYSGDIAIIYDLTGKGDKQLKLFNNETYDIIYQEIRNTGISIIFVREFVRKKKNKTSIVSANKNK